VDAYAWWPTSCEKWSYTWIPYKPARLAPTSANKRQQARRSWILSGRIRPVADILREMELHLDPLQAGEAGAKMDEGATSSDNKREGAGS
jgi:hypothetical protein